MSVQINFTAGAGNEIMGGGRPTVPTGQYQVMMTSSKETNNGGKGGIELEFTIQAGPEQGKVIEDYMCGQGHSADALKMTNRKLETLCRIMGMAGAASTQDFHGRPIILDVEQYDEQFTTKPSEGKPEGEVKTAKRNKINGWLTAQGVKVGDIVAGAAPAAVTAAPQAPAAPVAPVAPAAVAPAAAVAQPVAVAPATHAITPAAAAPLPGAAAPAAAPGSWGAGAVAPAAAPVSAPVAGAPAPAWNNG